MPPVDGEIMEITNALATLGVGGVLAGLMFLVYRKDIKQYTDLWKTQAELNRTQTEFLIGVIKDNTASNTRLVTLLESQERNALRKSDIEDFLSKRIGEIRKDNS